MKDTNNLLSYNQWSCGDYTNDLTDFTQDITSKITNDFCTQGENCVQLSRTESHHWIRIPFTVSSTGEYTATIKIRGKQGYLRVLNGDTIISQVGTPLTNEWETVSLSANLTNLTGNTIAVVTYFGDIFIDDVSLVSS